jgi:Animal haem peroxidase
MPRSLHGRVKVTDDTLAEAREEILERIADVEPGFAVVKRLEFERRFDFLFLDLQDDPANLLPVSRATRDALRDLGEEMADSNLNVADGDANFSAAYTYFGQFVDHDITLEKSSQPGMKPPVEEDLEPLPLDDVRNQTRNVRTGVLELDSVYNLPAPRDPEDNLKMKLGRVTPSGGTANKDDFNDLPRRRRIPDDIKRDREAKIGDPRNDENLIVAQMHVAFLRAHNRIVEETSPPQRFKKAKRRLRRHYQHIILHDFLKKIAEPSIVDDTIRRNRVYNPGEDEFFMPLEFSVAAYRFGHSMVRGRYNFNENFPDAGLDLLFTFTALSGELGESDTLPDIWIIQWERFFRGFEDFNKARKIDTQLVEPLEHLQTMAGEEEGEGDPRRLAAKLAIRNLLRGYQLRMPTGQAVARSLQEKLKGMRDIPVLSPQQIKAAAASNKQRDVLNTSGFDERTPLWYYILAEAAFLRDGRRLGPVGSTIVAEVLVGLIRRSPDSILAPGIAWKPNLPSEEPGEFTLHDLLNYASRRIQDD